MDVRVELLVALGVVAVFWVAAWLYVHHKTKR